MRKGDERSRFGYRQQSPLPVLVCCLGFQARLGIIERGLALITAIERRSCRATAVW